MHTSHSIQDLRYILKEVPEDFRVSEVSYEPACAPTKKGQSYTYIVVEKKGMTTFQAFDVLSSCLQLKVGDFEAQGLKDEDGITQQLLSVHSILPESVIRKCNTHFNVLSNTWLQIKKIHGYGSLPVSPKILHGNRFQIEMRDLCKKVADRVYAYCKAQTDIAFINYFDTQRFGVAGSHMYNAHTIGACLINGDWRKAYLEYMLSGNRDKHELKNVSLFRHKMESARRIHFFLSAHNSFKWNRAITSKLRRNTCFRTIHHPILGDLRFSHQDSFECPNRLTISGYGYDNSLKCIVPKADSRSVVQTTRIFADLPRPDELHPGAYCMRLSFFLPAGSYATMLIQQLLFRNI